MAESTELTPGSVFGDYEILADVAAGGMGRVFRARHLTLQRDVALKVLSARFAADESYRQRFLSEARAAARLNHPNIVQIYDFGRVDTIFYLAMELVRGPSVGDRLRRDGKFSEGEAIAVVRQACTALGVAHRAGIVHRDVKPDNLVLSDDGLLKLVDLGLAKNLADDQNLTQTGVVSGTPHYISPEQIAGLKGIDGRADIYSLGATLFHMVTGHTPFEGSSPMVIITKHLHDAPQDPRAYAPTLSPGVCTVIRRMMARERDDRYQDMAAVDADLAAVHAGGTPDSRISAGAGVRVAPEAATTLQAAPAAAHGWDREVLAAIEARLAATIGPLARVLVRREAERASDVGGLCAALAPHIPSEAERRAFVVDASDAAARVQRHQAVSRPLTAPHDDPTVVACAPSHDSSGSVTWNPEALRVVEQRLATAIGPLAKVLVKRTARAASSWEELVSVLAANLPPAEQTAFRADAAKIAH